MSKVRSGAHEFTTYTSLREIQQVEAPAGTSLCIARAKRIWRVFAFFDRIPPSVWRQLRRADVSYVFADVSAYAVDPPLMVTNNT